jgi:hypothetical protein
MGTYVGDGDGIAVVADVLEQVLDEDRALSDLALDADIGVVGGGQGDLLRGVGSSGRHDDGSCEVFGGWMWGRLGIERSRVVVRWS